MSVLSFLKESVFAQDYASRKGFLQAMDPRFKTVIVILFIVLVMLAKTIPFIAVMYLICFIFIYASKINPGFFLKRTWVFIPLFSLFIAIPALFSVFTPGDALWSFNIFGLKLIVTWQGMLSAAFFVGRVVASVSFVVLLSLTTRHSELLRVLYVFKIPQVFVLTVGMCYRYIYLFVEIIENTYSAVRSRVGINVRHSHGREIAAWGISSLWQRSYHLNNQVYSAMLSRGYKGEPMILNDFHAGWTDWFWLGAVVILSISMFCFLCF
ncbi:MAG: cobalt ECF transporter T component CbiQ [Candidatus Omnitrophota bacterium]